MKFIRDIIREKSRADANAPALAATEALTPDDAATSEVAMDDAAPMAAQAEDEAFEAAEAVDAVDAVDADEADEMLPEADEVSERPISRRPLTRDLSLSPMIDTSEDGDEDEAQADAAEAPAYEDPMAQGENLFGSDDDFEEIDLDLHTGDGAADDRPAEAHRDANGMDIAAPDPDVVADSVAGLLSRNARAAAEAATEETAQEETAQEDNAEQDEIELGFETEIAARPEPQAEIEAPAIPEQAEMPATETASATDAPEAPARTSFSEIARMMQERIDQDTAARALEAEAANETTADATPEAIAQETAPLSGADTADIATSADATAGEGDHVFDIAAAAAPRGPRAGAGGRAGRAKTRLLGFSASNTAANPFEKAEDTQRPGQAEFPVGWLVVTDGPGRGQSFTLFHGVSQIGRGEDQAIRLDFGDNSISRQNHAAVAYDPETRGFYLGHGGKANIVRLDERPVLSTEELRGGQEIRIGETTLKFIALCDAGFDWNAADGEDERHALRG